MNKLKILLIIILSLTWGLVVYINTQYKEIFISDELHKSLQELKTNYNIVTHNYQANSEVVYKNIIANEEVIQLFSKSSEVDDIKKEEIRAQLYNLLKIQFSTVQELGVNILLFVDPNNEAFLRIHKPKQFGDNLEISRPAIAKVNQTQKQLIAFESGKLTHAFRNIYPLFNKSGKYIGCVDIGFNSKHLQDTLDTVHKIHSHFLINKTTVNATIWEKNKLISEYKQSMENHNYLISIRKDVTHELKEISQKTVKEYAKMIDKKIHTFKEFAIYGIDGENSVVIAFIPIFSFEKLDNPAAYLVSYTPNDQINKILNNWSYINITSFILIIMLGILVYRNLAHKYELEKEVENKTKELQEINESLELKIMQRTQNLEKQTKLAQAATKAKSEFLANMSHEIRTPLNAILGFIDILKNTIQGERELKYLNIIDTSSKSLLQIIEDILDFSKIESGKLNIDKIDFNPKSELEMLISLFDARCLEKDLTLTVNIHPNLPEVINTDPLRLKQVVSNLLSNAVKFSSKGGKITIDIDYQDTFLNLSVKDEGIGISQDKLQHIFEAFNQEDSSTTRNYGGTGLGLTISSQLVKLLGGELKVKSKLGQGSTFYFSIPITIGIDVQGEEKKYLNPEVKSFSHMKLLLVEDNPMNQLLMTEIFKEMDINFDIAKDGLESINMFKNNKYNLVFMDENMPGMNGIEATKNILEYEKLNNAKHTPIVALTANALKDDKERFLSVGMDEYLTKPLNKNKLVDTLNKFCN